MFQGSTWYSGCIKKTEIWIESELLKSVCTRFDSSCALSWLWKPTTVQRHSILHRFIYVATLEFHSLLLLFLTPPFPLDDTTDISPTRVCLCVCVGMCVCVCVCVWLSFRLGIRCNWTPWSERIDRGQRGTYESKWKKNMFWGEGGQSERNRTGCVTGWLNDSFLWN